MTRHQKILSLLPLLIGGLIYILFRVDTLRMFNWFEKIGLLEHIDHLRQFTLHFANGIPEWILYSLPDGLWLFSYTTLLLGIWDNRITNKNLSWIAIIPTIAILSELGQLAGAIPGTFDIMDLLLYLLGSFLPFLIFTNSITFKSIKHEQTI